MGKKKEIKGFSKKILLKLASDIIPKGGAFDIGAEDVNFLPKTEELISAFNPLVKIFLPFLFIYIQFNSLFYKGKLYTMLSQSVAEDYLEGLENSRFYHRRLIILGCKVMIFLSVYDDDNVAASIGYHHLSNFQGVKR